ncbi:CoA transferase [bacterium]|nr:CoA transferase [bacterium]
MQKEYQDFARGLFDKDQIPQKPEALAGLRVLDLSHMIFGPTAAKTLGQYGAEVIKVEVPYQGDYWRSSSYWGKFWKHSNPFWHFINHSKYFVAIDVKKARGKEMILKLAEMSDVVIENFSPGTVDAWGIGYRQIREINPRVIYASCSTFGQYGPFRYLPGWDLLAQGASGMLAATGHPDTDKYFKVPDFYGDFFPGVYAAMQIMIALNAREQSGKGQYLDIAQAEILMRALPHFTYEKATGNKLGRTGNSDPTMAPSGIFKTGDNAFIALAIGSDRQFQALCNGMQTPELAADSRFEKAVDRLKPEAAQELNAKVTSWVASHTRQALIDSAGEFGFPLAPVMDDLDISEDEWRRERGNVMVFDDEMYGEFVLESSTTLMSRTPSRIKWLTRPLGYHNRYIFKKLLGMSEAEIVKLEGERAVGYWDFRVGQRPPVYYDIDNDPLFNYGKENPSGHLD